MTTFELRPVPYHLDVYRCTLKSIHVNKLYELLGGIRPRDTKISRIIPGNDIYNIDLSLYEEELMFLKLALPSFTVEWISFELHQID
jgi:hypothetical protein